MNRRERKGRRGKKVKEGVIWAKFITLTLLLLLLLACNGTVQPTAVPSSPPAPLPTHSPSPTQTAVPSPAATIAPTSSPTSIPTLTPSPVPQVAWLYAVAVPFATVPDELSWAEVQAGWQKGHEVWGQLWLTSEVVTALTPLLGEPQYTAVSPAELVEKVTTNQGWTILPFEQLEPRLKVLAIDGASPLQPTFDPAAYPLQTTRPGEKSNYGRENLTFMALSGPVWLARGVGSRIEFHGAEYVIRDLAKLFGQMDIAHISHGVPFDTHCPPEELEAIGDTTFCEPDRYVEIIQQLNITINDMTGNHVNDWGLDNLEHTLDLYDTAGIDTFGGGRSLEEAQTPWLFEHNGSKIALLGCNPVGPAKAWANSSRGGAAPCDDYGWVGEKIQQLKAEGYLVVVVVQYEEFYHYHATSQQKADFKLLAELGADVVHGSQSHHPQTYGFEGAAVLHYGTGNTIGDQMYEPEVRESLIDVYVIQEGRVLGVWIWTGFIEDYCCNRPMSAEQRAELLGKLFAEME